MKSKFWVFFSILFLAAFVLYNMWTIPRAFEIGYPYKPSEVVGSIIFVPIAVYLLAIMITGYLTMMSYRALRIIPKRKKLSLLALNRFYALMFISSLILEIGVIELWLKDTSDASISIGGIVVYTYSLSLALGYFVAGFMALWLFVFADNEYHGKLSLKRLTPYLILLIIYLIFSFDYRNWYGVVGWKIAGETSVREITSFLLLILLLISVIWAVIPLRKRIKIEEDRIKRTRLKLILTGFLVFLGFFVFTIIDAAIGLPYTLWMIPAYICALLGICLIWLGFLPPRWLLIKLEKR